jgi:hypothetical protein
MTAVAMEMMVRAVHLMNRAELIEALLDCNDDFGFRLTRLRLRRRRTTGLRRLLLAAVELRHN